MVSFTSIAQGIALISILMMSSEAAPAAGSSITNTKPVPTNETLTAIPLNETLISFEELPPIIASRVIPVTNPVVVGDLTAESRISAENRDWFVAHGGNLTQLQRRDASSVSSTGLTLVVPANAPPVKSFLASSTVTTATTAQITTFKLFAAIAASSYCDSVIISQKWNCTYCQKYVPDGKIIVAFETANHKVGGVLLRSDAEKTIYVVFRGSNNLDNWITVSTICCCWFIY